MTEATSTREMLATLLAKADQKLGVARRDLNSGDFGDAVSRAYYAVFHALTAVLLERGLSYSSHGQALGAFNRELVKTGGFPRDTYRKLQKLFDDRQTGDYGITRVIDEETAGENISFAVWFIDVCREHLKAIREEGAGE